MGELLYINALILCEKLMINVIAGLRISARTFFLNKHRQVLELGYSEGRLEFLWDGVYLKVYLLD
jgi:hypothetical protein